MQTLGPNGEPCPFSFNFDPATFKVGDLVSYRVPERFDDFPFVGNLVGVYDDYVEICPNDPTSPGMKMRGTRESRPVVSAAAALPDVDAAVAKGIPARTA